MRDIFEKFKVLGVDNAPGQEVRKKEDSFNYLGENIQGEPVDFSHGDVDAHTPIPGSIERFNEGFKIGGAQAYTEYRGKESIREYLAEKISEFAGEKLDKDSIIITPGTQGALFLAIGANLVVGDKATIIAPDYFANRKLVEFFDGEPKYVRIKYEDKSDKAGIDFEELEKTFKEGSKLLLFSNPNNPTGVIYSEEEIEKIADLADKYDVTVIADELYSRQIFSGEKFTHMISKMKNKDKLITILGPSKTESMSGYRLGVGYGSKTIIARMEKLQAIVSLRAAGYSQAVLKDWFSEPENWLKDRIKDHEEIRDALVEKFNKAGFKTRKTQGGSYVFPMLPELKISLNDFVNALRIQANVIVTPGTEFGEEFTRHIRLNFSQDKKKAIDAVDRIIALAERYKK
ncbi:pyridoxal phosphate-dependent aminotransferase [Peptoniphilus catoniae]|uniref:pyridoxal phosphate-dependent aminotransferase n=1 Tax=Peptoniphilus catoniae TaxID=1660341 RepID=UPI0010FE91B9|nr:pyridoxal phosphate-dependent aminotransferase [Peptoniphilus catoniae]